MVIWKWVLMMDDHQEINVRKGIKWLHVGNQGRNLCIWGMVDENAPKATAKIRIIGTGNDFEENVGRHLGTAIIDPFVWHVFLEE